MFFIESSPANQMYHQVAQAETNNSLLTHSQHSLMLYMLQQQQQQQQCQKSLMIFEQHSHSQTNSNKSRQEELSAAQLLLGLANRQTAPQQQQQPTRKILKPHPKFRIRDPSPIVETATTACHSMHNDEAQEKNRFRTVSEKSNLETLMMNLLTNQSQSQSSDYTPPQTPPALNNWSPEASESSLSSSAPSSPMSAPQSPSSSSNITTTTTTTTTKSRNHICTHENCYKR
jgi:hypothetical protein